MYDVRKKKVNVQKDSIYRFMIDQNHQGKGDGRAALSKTLQEIRVTPGVNRISIGHMPKNPVAKQFYASFDLMKVGLDRYGEINAVLKL
jgi:diamine N-acetyltransferase